MYTTDGYMTCMGACIPGFDTEHNVDRAILVPATGSCRTLQANIESVSGKFSALPTSFG
jgi:hypothetical protein